MTFRTYLLAGLITALAAPAAAYASSSGLSRYDVDHGQVYLASERATPTPVVAQHEESRDHHAASVAEQRARHERAMAEGLVRMTKGDMEGSDKR